MPPRKSIAADGNPAPAKKGKTEQEECPYGANCFRTSEEHLAAFAHPTGRRSARKANAVQLQQQSNRVAVDEGQEIKEGKEAWEWLSDGTLYQLLPPRSASKSGERSRLAEWALGCDRIVAFDIDGTLIEPKSGAKFPKDRKDWRWWNSKVPEVLRALHVSSPGTRFVLFSNQGGIEKNHTSPASITGKVLDFQAELGFYFPCFLAGGTDKWRKPHSLMFKRFRQHCGNQSVADMLYVGDAAGRLKDWKVAAKRDFSCSDRGFASNCGMAFQTPEEFFLGESVCPPSKWAWGGIGASELECLLSRASAGSAASAASAGRGGSRAEQLARAPGVKQEIVVIVGLPASGKSTLSRRYFVPLGYERINRDELKTKQKCWAAAKAALAAGKSVVIDNTNPAAADREPYVQMARAIPGCGARCLVLETDRALAQHLNTLREVSHGVRRIPDVGFNVFKSHYKEPSAAEGFDAIEKLAFVPEFDSKDKMTRELFVERT